MIDSITPEQQAVLDKMIETYLQDITKPMDKSSAIEAVNKMYKSLGYGNPKVIIGKTPYETCVMAGLYAQQDGKSEIQLQEIKQQMFVCLWWRYWDCYYQFAKQIGVQFDEEKLDLFHEFIDNIYFIIPYNSEIAFISEPPTKVHWKDKKLHSETSPAIEFANSTDDKDIWQLYYLNGIKVPKELALTPSGLLDIEIFKNSNLSADVKAEFIRKYGIDRMVDMGKVVDTFENYEGSKNYDMYKASEYKIIDMSCLFSKFEYLPYLYMKNLTTNIYHLECVYSADKKIDTITKGLAIRMGGIDPESAEIFFIS